MGFASANDISEFNLGPYVLPLPSGVSTRSRGMEISEAVCPTGSSEATIIVSVKVSLRVRVASTPTRRTLSRWLSPGATAVPRSPPPSVVPVKILPNVSPSFVP